MEENTENGELIEEWIAKTATDILALHRKVLPGQYRGHLTDLLKESITILLNEKQND